MTTPTRSHHSTPSLWLLAIAASLLSVCIARAQNTGSKPGDVQTEEELARVGEALVTKVCSTACHGLEKLDEMRRTRGDWNDQVRQMGLQGAKASDAEFTTIKKYLTRYYGVVAVNTASSEELSAVLGVSAKDADAIVAYRTAHGKFADADALAKVPGIDKTRIEEQPQALRFK